MSRHRNVRSMNYKDEYDGYDDVYGHSVEDDSCISPSDAAQWLYDRARGTQHGIGSYLDENKDIPEEDEEASDDLPRRDSIDLPELSSLDKARLASCLEGIRNVIGDTIPERVLAKMVIKHDYDLTTSLDAVLNSSQDSDRRKDSIDTGPPSLALPAAKFATPTVTSTADVTIVRPTNVVKGFRAPTITSDQLKTPSTTVATHVLSITPRSQSPASGRNTPGSLDKEVNGKSNDAVNSGRSTPLNQGGTDSESQNIEDANLKTSARPQKESKYDVNEQYAKDRGSSKEQLHMIVIGHVDAGKSTLMGHLLCALGQVTQRTMHKYEQESKKLGKQSFMYAWVLDETGEERSRGITMDVGYSQFETDTKMVTLLDAPGHKDFIPNMISGAGQADVALLVVDATRGEFETGFDQGGQTREHALLVRSLGVNQLAVVVNKLDTVRWSQERFLEISSKMKQFLRQAGFRESDVTFIPCSGLTGENLVKAPAEDNLVAWYKGPTLIQVIDNFKTPERPINKPFRMSINDIFKGTGSGFCASGRVETGSLNVGDRILVCPSKETAQIKSISIDDMSRTVAFAGDQISVMLSGVDLQNVSVGYVLSDPVNVVPIATRFECRIVVFNVKVPITKGFPVVMHHQSLIEPVVVCKLVAQLHKSTGEVVKRKPRCIGNNSSALVEVQASRPLCLERYRDVKELGRLMMRVGGVTIAAGMITEIFN